MSPERTPPGDLGEIGHQIGQLAATLDEVHAAVVPPEPGAVVLHPRDVVRLRGLLAREADQTASTPDRDAARRTACMWLDVLLGDPGGQG